MPKFMTLRDGRRVALNDADEETRVNEGIAADPDTHESDEQEFANLRPVGRPRSEVTKERITIRLSPEVVDAFRATGKGWQTRMDAALKEWLKEHHPTPDP